LGLFVCSLNFASHFTEYFFLLADKGQFFS